jgi:tetratricopeptide (TPR) repeat protein
MVRLSRVLGVAGVLFSTGAPAVGRRPAADPSAMREAMRASEKSGESYASSASYAHFLKAQMLQRAGEHRRALNELRLALVTDEGNPYLMVALAEQYARMGDLTRAEKTLIRLLETAPSYPAAHLLLGRVLDEEGKKDRARVHLQKAVRLAPKTVEGWLALGQVELDTGRTDQCLEVMEGMARAIPGESKGFRMLGSVLSDRDDVARAERALRRAVEIDDSDSEAWTLLAQTYDRAERFAEAEEAYARALSRDPENLELSLAGGRVALKMGDAARARSWFDRVLSLSEDPEIAVRVSFAYLSTDRVEEAVEVLDRTRKRGAMEPRLSYYAGLMHERLRRFERAAAAYGEVPRSSELYVESQIRRGNALSLAGAHPRATEALRKFVEERPEQPGAHRGYARALERSGALREAERVLRVAVDRWHTADLYEALAENLQRQGRGVEAVKFLEDAVVARPEEQGLRFVLGAAYERHGKVEQSLTHLRAVLARNPDNPTVLNFIGYMLAEHGRDLDEAEGMVRRALQLKPGTAAYLDSLGWVYYRRGQTEQAVALLEQAAALDPGEPVIADHLGDAYRRADRKADAARAYRKALEALQQADDAIDARGLRNRVERKLKALSTESAGR